MTGTRRGDVLLTALAPVIWGSTYWVSTQYLAGWSPLTVALLRALPAGLVLLVWVRVLPRGIWWWRATVLGALNFSIFWGLLFVAAYRLPGGVAATLGAVQPLLVLALAAGVLGQPMHTKAVLAALGGLLGVALLALTAAARLDGLGVAAALSGAVSMAFGTVLTRKWKAPVSPIALTAWQLTAGGLLLLPVSLLAAPQLPALNLANVLALIWLGLVGAAVSYALWFRGIGRLGPSVVAPLGFLSPLVAVLLGWMLLGQSLTVWQLMGALVIGVCVWLNSR